MTFSSDNFKEVGGPGNSDQGGQVYVIADPDSTLAAMMADSYLDGVDDKLNAGDTVFMSGSDGNTMTRVSSTTAGVVVTVAGAATASQASQALSGAGAADLVSLVTLHTSTGADVVTLADGLYVGQMKIIVVAVDGGSTIVTPATFVTALTKTTMVAAGDACVLVWTGTDGWITFGVAGTIFSVTA